jgi:hypothetical protein
MDAAWRGAHEAREERIDEGVSKERAGAKRHASREGDQREPSERASGETASSERRQQARTDTERRSGWDEETESEGGHTIGILPGERREAANEYVDTAIATGMGHGRNAMVVMNGDAVIAIDGGGGTLSEIGFGHVFDRPIAGLGTHRIETLEGIEHVATPEAAVEYVETVSDVR